MFWNLKISYFRNGIENAKHWADTNIFTNRNDFYIEKTKDSMIAYLNISEARQSDKGPYRCRVDFWKAATRNIKITVNLAEEPKSVQIFNGQEKEMQGFISTRVNSTIRQDGVLHFFSFFLYIWISQFLPELGFKTRSSYALRSIK